MNTPTVKIARKLFFEDEPLTTESIDWMQVANAKIVAEASAKWDFDFENDHPLETPTGLQWQEIESSVF